MAKVIHTNLYSDKAQHVIESVLGQLSDGWGENNPRNDRYWMFAHVERNEDGEVVIVISENYGKSYGRRWIENGFSGMNELRICEFFARMVKKTMKMELVDSNAKDGWKRNNTSFLTSYLNRGDNISVAEVYCIYEALLRRPIGITKYDVSIINRVFGQKLDAATIEKNKQIKMLNAEHTQKIAEMKKMHENEIENLNEAFNEKLKVVAAEFEAKIKALAN